MRNRRAVDDEERGRVWDVLGVEVVCEEEVNETGRSGRIDVGERHGRIGCGRLW